MPTAPHRVIKFLLSHLAPGFLNDYESLAFQLRTCEKTLELFAEEKEGHESKISSLERENQELRQRISVLAAEATNLRTSAVAAQAKYEDASARAASLQDELIRTLKTEANWYALGLSNRPLHPDVPLPSLPTPPSFVKENGEPVEMARGQRISKIAQEQTRKVVKLTTDALEHYRAQMEQIANEDPQLYNQKLREVMEEMYGVQLPKDQIQTLEEATA